MIPFKSIFGLVAICGALAGCTSSGQLTPATSAAIATAYNDVCNALPALGPASATMNANAKNAYAQAQTICAAGRAHQRRRRGNRYPGDRERAPALFQEGVRRSRRIKRSPLQKLRVKFGNVNLRSLKFDE